MAHLEKRLFALETNIATTGLKVIVVRKGETNDQARKRAGNPAFVNFVPEKNAPDQPLGDWT